MAQTPHIPFMKMHGLGNDFVVLDTRAGGAARGLAVGPDLARAMGDRHRGVGYDQLVVVTDTDAADAALTFWNADGTTAGACGNGTRCVAAWMMSGSAALDLVTERGTLGCRAMADGRVEVNMGAPLTDWRDIPLARETDTLHLPIDGDPVATGMGNPHCTFFVDDAEGADLAAYGRLEHHPLFPERTNVQVAQVISRDLVRMRVWERGVGPTLASGSSSCAVAVAAARRGLTGRAVTVRLDGGDLDIDWRADGVRMTGPAAHVFDGVWHG